MTKIDLGFPPLAMLCMRNILGLDIKVEAVKVGPIVCVVSPDTLSSGTLTQASQLSQ